VALAGPAPNRHDVTGAKSQAIQRAAAIPRGNRAAFQPVEHVEAAGNQSFVALRALPPRGRNPVHQTGRTVALPSACLAEHDANETVAFQTDGGALRGPEFQDLLHGEPGRRLGQTIHLPGLMIESAAAPAAEARYVKNMVTQVRKNLATGQQMFPLAREQLPAFDGHQAGGDRPQAGRSVGRRRGLVGEKAGIFLLEHGVVGLVPRTFKAGRIRARNVHADTNQQAGGVHGGIDPRNAQAPCDAIDIPAGRAGIQPREEHVGAQLAHGDVFDSRADGENFYCRIYPAQTPRLNRRFRPKIRRIDGLAQDVLGLVGVEVDQDDLRNVAAATHQGNEVGAGVSESEHGDTLGPGRLAGRPRVLCHLHNASGVHWYVPSSCVGWPQDAQPGV